MLKVGIKESWKDVILSQVSNSWTECMWPLYSGPHRAKPRHEQMPTAGKHQSGKPAKHEHTCSQTKILAEHDLDFRNGMLEFAHRHKKHRRMGEDDKGVYVYIYIYIIAYRHLHVCM